MMAKITAGATGALGNISMTGYTTDNLSLMVSKVTAGATGALGRISMTGYTSDNLSSMVEQVTAGATGALGNISMTNDNGSTYGSSNLSGMMAKITAGATGALGKISMTDDNGSTYDSSDLTGMMAKITAGATGGLAYITSGAHSSEWTIDNATLTTQIKSGGSGALGNIRMSGFDHDNSSSWSTYTNAIAGPHYKLPDTGQTDGYTTTFGEDNDYLINAPSFTNNGSDTVTDDNTLLMWQRQDDNTPRSPADAGTYCSGLSLGGHSDWRLPEVYEFHSIVDYRSYQAGNSSPFIDTTYFPSTQSTYYWSSSMYRNNSTSYNLQFTNGTVSYHNNNNNYYVRCVRGTSTTRSFTDNSDSTVNDTKTGLVWQQTSSSKMTWESALNLCEGLTLGSQSDWRLPNIKELGSIVDVSEYNPTIDNTAFPSTYSDEYWSSSPASSNDRYGINFKYGSIFIEPLSMTYYVRCVRGG
jgi:hypothetical protein